LKNAKNGGILGLRERSHLNCGLSFFIFGGQHEEKQESKAPSCVDLREMQDLLG
jgi:hypothetical protein